MPLHRLTVPGYFGGLPGTHDYINDPAANGDPGTPAPADGKKGSAAAPGDQNEGTYFVAFSEPAQSIDINRPAQALAQNTDFLDDVIHRDVAVPTYVDVASGHGGTASIVLTGDVFVGTGMLNTQGARDQLVQFVDAATGLPIIWQVSAAPEVKGYASVTLIHDGASVSQVGNGFFTNPTVNLSLTIPNAVGFRVLYYVRGRLKDQPDNSYSRLESQAVGLAQVQALLGALILNAADKYQANTFATLLTQTFLGPLVSGENRAAVPILDVTNSVDTAPDDAANNPYKIIFQLPSDTVQKTRIYAGNDNVGAGTLPLGHFALVQNAIWNPSTRLWSRDDVTKSALALFLRTTTEPAGPGVANGLTGATGASQAQGTSMFAFLVKAPGVGTWGPNQWDKDSFGHSGHMRISGEYGYASSIGAREMHMPISVMTMQPGTGSGWTLNNGGLVAGGGPGTMPRWSSATSGDVLFIPFEVPYGAVFSVISVVVDPVAASLGNRMQADLIELDPTTRDTVVIDGNDTDGSSSLQTISKTLSGPYNAVAGRLYFIRVTHALVGGTERVISASVNYNARVNAPGHGFVPAFTYRP